MKTTCLYKILLCPHAKNLLFCIAFIIILLPLKAQDLMLPTNVYNKYSLTSEQLTFSNSNIYAPLKFKGLNHKNHSSSEIIEQINLQIDKDILSYISQNGGDKLILEVPVSYGHSVPLILKETKVFSEGYVLTTSQHIIGSKNKRPKYYRGQVAGDNNSQVSVSITSESIRIMIIDKNGTYQLSPTNQSKGNYSLFNSRKLKSNRHYECATPDIELPHKTTSKRIQKEKSNSDSCIPIYLETDRATLHHFNNDPLEVEMYFGALMNEVALIYESEGINISVSQIHIATTPEDDFSAPLSIASSVIEEFAKKRKNHFRGRLAHFLSHRNLLGGIGWVGVLCNNYTTFEADWNYDGVLETHHYGPYAVSSSIGTGLEEYPIYSWDVGVVAHEIGHNIGSPHTHACAWSANNQAIDDCQSSQGDCNLIESPVPDHELGTIMSYCNLTSTGIDLNKGFGSLPGALIRQKVSEASCTLSCTVENIYGCMDESYHSYNLYANTDDGSCSGTCYDGIKNGDETGQDCGGEKCLPCKDVCEDNYLKLEVVLDGFPTETTWVLINSISGDTIEKGGPYSTQQAYKVFIYEYCLPDGSFTLKFNDQFGDGFCCTNGQGSYHVMNENSVSLVEGGNFESTISHQLIIANDECPPLLHLSNVSLSGMYMASETLMASNSESNSGPVTFMAPVVEIDSDFSINVGATLQVSTTGCK